MDAIGIWGADVAERFMVQMGLSIRDTTFLPDNVLLTSVVSFSQNADEDGVGRDSEQSFSLDIVGVADEGGGFSQDTRQASLAMQTAWHGMIGAKGTAASDIGRVDVGREAAVVEIDIWRDEQLLDGEVQRKGRQSGHMDNLLAELWRDDGAKELDEHAHPVALVDNVQLLQPLAHGSAQDVVCLEIPSYTGAVLLVRGGSLGLAASKEDDLVLFSGNQLFLSRQSGQDVGQKRIVVDLMGIRKGGSIENEDGQARLGRQW
jgi:hypothetical protein